MHWARVGEAGFDVGLRFLLWIYWHGGIWLFRFCLIFAIGWFFLTRPQARHASLEYLARLHATSGGVTPAPTWWNGFRHFMAFGETMLGKILASDERERVPELASAEGLEAFHRAVDAGRGVLIVTAHFGNLMLLRRTGQGHRAHVRITLLAYTRHAVRFQRILRALDPGLELDLIRVDRVGVGTAMALSERIMAGGIVVITGDRVPASMSDATMRMPFLGKEASFPVGPYILAAALGCPVFMMFGARTRTGTAVAVRSLADSVVLPRKGREAALRSYLGAYVAALSEECRKHPLQWFNFFPFWQTPKSDLQRSNDEKSTKPLA
ncbi:MAG: acyltransferase [Azoarcus sp.]|nr:acyltransferase [Azoarcus sp.]